MKYVLDFDRTLFDVERLYESLDRMNIRHLAGTQESMARLDMSEMVFEDVHSFLSGKPKENLFILSSSSGISGDWEDEYQRKKINASGVSELVSEVYVMKGLKGDSLAGIAKRFPPNEPIVFIDDRIEQCLSVKENVQNAECYLMVRNEGVVGDATTVRGIRVVRTLREVDDIIEGV